MSLSLVPMVPAVGQHSGSVDLAAVHARYLRALPLALVVFDGGGTILYANHRVRQLLAGGVGGTVDGGDGDPVGDPVGRNVLEIVHPDDHGYALELLEFSVGLPSRVLGPIRLRYVTLDGSTRFTDFWVENRIDDPGIGGYVVLLTEEATQQRLAEAVTGIARNEDLASVLSTVAVAMHGHPMQARGVVIGRRSDGTVGPLHTTDLPAALTGGLPGGPWDDTHHLVGGPIDVCTVDDLSPRIAQAARQAGFGAVWCRPVPVPAAPDQTTLVCWRREAGPPSPNQRIHLTQGVDILGLAFGQHAQRRQLETLAYTDPLTGLANRAQLDGLASMDLEGVAVIYIDLDDFKEINDRLGHEVGDLALRHTAMCLRSVVRHDDKVIRLGGDEFIVICRPPCEPEAMTSVARRLIDAVSEPVRLAGHTVSLGASVGIVHHRDHPDLEHLIQEADAALYLAKAKGRGKWWMAPVG